MTALFTTNMLVQSGGVCWMLVLFVTAPFTTNMLVQSGGVEWNLV